MFLGSALMILLVSSSASARPEPPISQYLPPDQQYGPPRKNDYAGQVGQNGPNTGGFGSNQYLPPNQQYGLPGGGGAGGYNDGYNDVSSLLSVTLNNLPPMLTKFPKLVLFHLYFIIPDTR